MKNVGTPNNLPKTKYQFLLENIFQLVTHPTCYTSARSCSTYLADEKNHMNKVQSALLLIVAFCVIPMASTLSLGVLHDIPVSNHGARVR